MSLAVVTSAQGGDSEEEDVTKERHCDSLIMCIVTTLNEGMRNGGGIGDVLRKPSSRVSHTPLYLSNMLPVTAQWVPSRKVVLSHKVKLQS